MVHSVLSAGAFIWEMFTYKSMHINLCLHVNSPTTQHPLFSVTSYDRGEMQCALWLLVFAPTWVKPGSVMSQFKVSECWQLNMFLHNLTLSSPCPPIPSSAFTASCHFHPASLVLAQIMIKVMIKSAISKTSETAVQRGRGYHKQTVIFLLTAPPKKLTTPSSSIIKPCMTW